MTDAFAASLIVRAIGWALMQSLWQGAIVGVVTAFALLALRRSAGQPSATPSPVWGWPRLSSCRLSRRALHARELRTSGIRLDLARAGVCQPGRASGRQLPTLLQCRSEDFQRSDDEGYRTVA